LVDALSAGANEAFLSAAHGTTLICLGIVVVAAVAVGFGLPTITPPTKGGVDPAPSTIES
jgi:hypothetical protein